MADSGKVPYVVIEKVTDYSQGMLISFFSVWEPQLLRPERVPLSENKMREKSDFYSIGGLFFPYPKPPWFHRPNLRDNLGWGEGEKGKSK